MLLAVDTSYGQCIAHTAGVVFENWESDTCNQKLHISTPIVSQYISGAFYQRELPCILALLDRLNEQLECIVIDGYVSLGAQSDPGLGMKLWDALGHATPVIGVAKTRFAGTPAESELLRGNSKMPLFVTSTGIPLELAKRNVASMAGLHRMPKMLKLADTECRKHGGGGN